MKKDTINLLDTLKIFKKNLKGFYFSLAAGLIIALIGTFINLKYIEKKIVLTANMTIKNPLQNYMVLDLFSLDRIQISDSKISVTSTQEKIKNYYLITNEYLELILNTMDLKKYNIDEQKYGYKINTEKKNNEFTIQILNISNPDDVEDNLKKMVKDFNKIIKPIILQNIYLENTAIENYLEISGEKLNSDKLSVLIKIRKETLKYFENQNLEIFELSSFKSIQEISNTRIIIVSFLITLSLFLMFIILRK